MNSGIQRGKEKLKKTRIVKPKIFQSELSKEFLLSWFDGYIDGLKSARHVCIHAIDTSIDIWREKREEIRKTKVLGKAKIIKRSKV